MAATTHDVACPACQQPTFELRLLRDEGVGLARCDACGRVFLLLDSVDYWYDVIQQRYPNVVRCGCRGSSFRLSLKYSFRDDGDVRHVALHSVCESCEKSKRQLSIHIDYSPTTALVKQPLVFCATPKILYDVKELSLFALPDDIFSIVRFFAEDEQCRLAGCVFERRDWKCCSLSLAEAEHAITSKRALSYQFIYAAQRAIDISSGDLETAKGEDRFWKRGELVRIGAPTLMGYAPNKTGRLYSVNFANEFVDDERVIKKSARFRALTQRLTAWLADRFVDWRGADCYDNPRELQRLFKNEYQAKH
jgi:hypothetical protein